MQPSCTIEPLPIPPRHFRQLRRPRGQVNPPVFPALWRAACCAVNHRQGGPAAASLQSQSVAEEGTGRFIGAIRAPVDLSALLAQLNGAADRAHGAPVRRARRRASDPGAGRDSRYEAQVRGVRRDPGCDGNAEGRRLDTSKPPYPMRIIASQVRTGDGFLDDLPRTFSA